MGIQGGPKPAQVKRCHFDQKEIQHGKIEKMANYGEKIKNLFIERNPLPELAPESFSQANLEDLDPPRNLASTGSPDRFFHGC